jgi:hypothetical protein
VLKASHKDAASVLPDGLQPSSAHRLRPLHHVSAAPRKICVYRMEMWSRKCLSRLALRARTFVVHRKPVTTVLFPDVPTGIDQTQKRVPASPGWGILTV